MAEKENFLPSSHYRTSNFGSHSQMRVLCGGLGVQLRSSSTLLEQKDVSLDAVEKAKGCFTLEASPLPQRGTA